MTVLSMTREACRHRAAALLAALAALTTWPAMAAEQRHPCTAHLDPMARLACYDAIFGEPVAPAATAGESIATGAAAAGPAAAAAGAAAAVAPAAATIAPAPAPVRSATEQFGFHGEPPRPVVKEPAREAEVDSIDSVITQVTTRPTGELIIALENGQVWVQLETDSRVRLRPGDAVTIRKAALGSYKLTSGPSTTRVRRTR